MNNKLNSWWNPDLRPENIEDYEETYTSTSDTGEEQTQTETYKFIKLPIIINKVLSRAAFIWTHAGCVWYNRLSNRTVKDELDALNAKSLTITPYTASFNTPAGYSEHKIALPDVPGEILAVIPVLFGYATGGQKPTWSYNGSQIWCENAIAGRMDFKFYIFSRA